MTESVHALISFGKANFSSTLMSLSAQTVEPNFGRASAAAKSLTKVTWQEFASGTRGQKINGSMYRTTVSFSEGTILCFMSSWRRAAGVAVRDGAVFLRLRASAASIELHATIPQERENLLGPSVIAFTGRADILTLADLEEMRYDIPRWVVTGFMDPQEIDETFSVVRVAGEITPRPIVKVVEAEDGTQKTIIVARPPARRMIFKRKG